MIIHFYFYDQPTNEIGKQVMVSAFGFAQVHNNWPARGKAPFKVKLTPNRKIRR